MASNDTPCAISKISATLQRSWGSYPSQAPGQIWYAERESGDTCTALLPDQARLRIPGHSVKRGLLLHLHASGNSPGCTLTGAPAIDVLDLPAQQSITRPVYLSQSYTHSKQEQWYHVGQSSSLMLIVAEEARAIASQKLRTQCHQKSCLQGTESS